MKTTKLLFHALVNSLGVLVYTSLVAFLMNNGQKLVGPANNFWGPVAFLLLFVLSATIVGLLVLGRPGYLYFNGFRRDGILLLLFTISFLLVITILVFGALVILK